MAVFSSISKTLPDDSGNDPPSSKARSADPLKSGDDLGFTGPQVTSSKHDEFSLANSPTRKMPRQ